MSTINIEKIVGRVKLVKDLSKDTDVARFLGITNKVLSSWKKRNSKTGVDKILQKCSDINPEWLKFGSSPKKS